MIFPRRWWVWLPPLILAAATAGELIAPGLSKRFASLPFLASLLIFGMPHGAIDLWVLKQLGSHRWRTAIGWPLAIYTAGGVATLVLLLSLPRATLIAFLFLAAVHWGRADVWEVQDVVADMGGGDKGESDEGESDEGESDEGESDEGDERPPPSLWSWIAAVGRGGILLATPLHFQTAATIAIFDRLLTLIGGQPMPAVGDFAAEAFYASVLAMGLTVLVQLARGDVGSAVQHASESSIVIGALAVLDPLFGVGLYFWWWHALRQCRRLVDHPMLQLGVGNRVVSIAWLHVMSLPLLLPTLLGFGITAWSLCGGYDAAAWATLLIAAFAILTPSHHVLIERLPVK